MFLIGPCSVGRKDLSEVTALMHARDHNNNKQNSFVSCVSTWGFDPQKTKMRIIQLPNL